MWCGIWTSTGCLIALCAMGRPSWLMATASAWSGDTRTFSRCTGRFAHRDVNGPRRAPLLRLDTGGAIFPRSPPALDFHAHARKTAPLTARERVSMTVRVAINGFGRIGRLVLRSIVEHARTDIEVVAINDLGPVETNAHLLRYDSVHGRFPGQVVVDGDTIDVGHGKIKVTAVRNPAELPHRALGVDIALECTGLFTSKEKASAHLAAGAKR